MLASKLMSYSEILEVLSIDNGHVSYHLESLSELVIHTSDGFYKLSSIGVASTKLMSGVEEQKASAILPSKKQTILKIVTVASVVLLASALVPFSLFAYGYTVSIIAGEIQLFMNFSFLAIFAINICKTSSASALCGGWVP